MESGYKCHLDKWLSHLPRLLEGICTLAGELTFFRQSENIIVLSG